MSFEAVFYVRKRGATGDFSQKWLTVPTNNRQAAVQAFNDLGYETRGGTIMDQAEATQHANQMAEESIRA